MPGTQPPPSGFPAVANPLVFMPYRQTTTEFPVFQLRPDTWDAAADWCGGTKTIVNGGQAIELPDDQGTVVLGDFIVTHDGGVTYEVEPADGFGNRWRFRDTASSPEDPPPLSQYVYEWPDGD